EAVAGLGVPGLEVNEAKAAQVRQAEWSTQSARATLVTMSLLVVAAAATVVVHLTLMLAEERRRRLGTLRALGLSRSGLVFLSVLESALYSLAGAVVGVLPGLALARYLGPVVAEASAALSRSESTGYQLAVRPETVAVAVSLAAMLTVVSFFGLSLVVAANLALVDRFLALVSPRLGATLRAPVAYMTRRPLRTGLTTGAFGIVLAAITVFAVVGGSYQPDYARDSAGFDVIVRSAQPAITLSPALQAQIARAEVIPTRLYLGRFLAPNRTGYAGGASTYV